MQAKATLNTGRLKYRPSLEWPSKENSLVEEPFSLDC